MVFETWLQAIEDAFQQLWLGTLDFIPALVGALLVLIIGWLIAIIIGKIVSQILIQLRFNELFDKTDWKRALDKARFTVNPAEFLGAIVKWILVIVFLMAAAEILNLPGFVAFLSKLVNFLPNVFVAALIFVVAVIVADIAEKIIVAAVEKMQVGYSHITGVIAKWAIWIIALFAILLQLGVAREMVQTLFTGIIAFFVIAGGLAFGLGGKEVAAEILQEVKRRVKG